MQAIKEALGEKENRVTVSDYYTVYQGEGLKGVNQYCWTHLIREGKVISPTLHHELQGIFHQIKERLTLPLSGRDPTSIRIELERLTTATYPDVEKGCSNKLRTLQARIKKEAGNYLTCLTHENVAPENNYAERLLRPQVIKRKIFGGCRSTQGATTHAVNSSVLTTACARTPGSFFGLVMPLLRLAAATA